MLSNLLSFLLKIKLNNIVECVMQGESAYYIKCTSLCFVLCCVLCSVLISVLFNVLCSVYVRSGTVLLSCITVLS